MAGTTVLRFAFAPDILGGLGQRRDVLVSSRLASG